jgi:hypothetical protein
MIPAWPTHQKLRHSERSEKSLFAVQAGRIRARA